MINNNENIRKEKLKERNEEEKTINLKGDLDEFIFNNGFSKYISER